MMPDVVGGPGGRCLNVWWSAGWMRDVVRCMGVLMIGAAVRSRWCGGRGGAVVDVVRWSPRGDVPQA